LYVETNASSLDNRRIELVMQYATKLKAYPSNPAYDCVVNPLIGLRFTMEGFQELQ
jgi:hypothetical protein